MRVNLDSLTEFQNLDSVASGVNSSDIQMFTFC